jgi:ribulose-phosphate 3-epimerase
MPSGQIALAASVLYADFKRLPEQFRAMDQAGLDRFHFDIMDGHFVPGFGLSPAIMASVRALTHTPFEAHLMIERPEQFIEAVALAGAATIAVHAESTIQLRRVIGQIRKTGCRPVVALNSSTLPDALSYILPDVSGVLLVSSEVSQANQPVAASIIDRIGEVRKMIIDQQLEVEIAVEGGVTAQTIPECIRAGATAFVLGSSTLFQAGDLSAVLREIRHLTLDGTQTHV